MIKLTILYVAVLFVLITIGQYLYKCLDGTVSQKLLTIGTLLGTVGAIFGLFVLSFQALKLKESIDLQAKTFSYENRPYLHAILKPFDKTSSFISGKDIIDHETFHGGGLLYLKNDGKIPASDIKAEYKVVSDEMRDIDVVRYFEERGGFPHIKTVFPNQNDTLVYLNPQIGKKPNLLYIWAMVTYTGADPNKRYWYVFSHLYSIKYIEVNDEKGNKMHSIQISLIDPSEDWDRNSDIKAPQYKEPDWGKYLKVLDRRR